MSNRRSVAGVALVLVLTVPIGGRGHADELARSLELIERLETSITSVTLDQVPLPDVLAELSDRLDCSVEADWDALDMIGIDQRDDLSLQLSRQSGLAVLSAVALMLGDAYDRPVFEAHAGRMILTSVEATAGMRETTAYDVRDILADTSLMQRLRESAARESDETGSEEATDAIEPPVDPTKLMPPDWPKPPPIEGLPEDGEIIRRPPTPGEELINLITDHVDPEAWQNFGGSRAKTTDHAGVLLVTAPPMTHHRLRGALGQLRRAIGLTVRLEALLLELPTEAFESIMRSEGRRPIRAALSIKDAGEIRWSGGGEATRDQSLEAGSVGVEQSITLRLTPRFSSEDGALTLSVGLTVDADPAILRLETTTSLPTMEGVSILPLPLDGEAASRLVLIVQTQRI